MRTSFGKTRDVEEPYAVYENSAAGKEQRWEWRVLKTYRHSSKEGTNPYAIWYVAAKSPNTFGRWEYGDTHKEEILKYAVFVDGTEQWREEYPV